MCVFMFSCMYYLRSRFRKNPTLRVKEHDSTRSRDRLLNFNVSIPLTVVKMISQDWYRLGSHLRSKKICVENSACLLKF